MNKVSFAEKKNSLSAIIVALFCLFFLPSIVRADFAAPSSEHHWIITEICRDLTEIYGFAAYRQGKNVIASGTGGSKDSKTENSSEALVRMFEPLPKIPGEIKNHVWDPANYVSFLAQLRKAIQLEIPVNKASPSSSIVENLLNPTVTVLANEDLRLSKLMQSDMLSPDLHEEAAFLLAVFALREAAGSFSDSRKTFCAITSHLTMAQFLRGEAGIPSLTGVLADTILQTLLNRQTDALAILDKLKSSEKNQPGLSSWIKGLRMRNTGDWRAFNPASDNTLFQAIEYFRATSQRVGNFKAIEFLRTSVQLQNVPDAGRIALEQNWSVQEGHLFAKTGIGIEIRESAELLKQYKGLPMKQDEFVSALNASGRRFSRGKPGEDPGFNVIGWDAWADFQQRHLLHILTNQVRFFDNMLGVREAAEQTVAGARKDLGKLDLFSLFELQLSPDWPLSDGCRRRLSTLETEKPDRMTFANWKKLVRSASPDISWFAGFPQGTFFDVENRLESFFADGFDTRLRETCPYNQSAIQFLIRKNQSKAGSFEELKKGTGVLSEYDAVISEDLYRLGWRFDREKALSMLENLCGLKPDKYISLGEILRQGGKFEAAAEAFQNAVDKAPDRVRVSNSVEWLVNYYFDNGKKGKAIEVADMAAKVYSHTGLRTRGLLAERMGNFAEAEEIFSKIRERYESNGDLIGLFMRHKAEKDASGKTYEEKMQELLKDVFPDGLKQVVISDFSGPPAGGAIFRQTTPQMKSLGFNPQSVVVGLDGYKVENEGQYLTVRDLSNDPLMKFIIWNGDSYVEINGSVPYRKFGVSMGTFRK